MIVILNKEKADYKNNYEGSIQDILIYFSTKIKYQSIEVAKENLASLFAFFKEGRPFYLVTARRLFPSFMWMM